MIIDWLTLVILVEGKQEHDTEGYIDVESRKPQETYELRFPPFDDNQLLINDYKGDTVSYCTSF